MKITRRNFLKLAAATGAGGLIARPKKVRAARANALADNFRAMLVDTTLCVGCRACEAACSEANHLPHPAPLDKGSVFKRKRVTDSRTYTVVNRYPNPGAAETPRFVKAQCMHCVQPACATACPVRAMAKSAEGPVIYHQERCIGCRYCMVACPFGVPKFEYEKAVPSIRKCAFCAERQKEGKLPACAEVCPSGALKFGTRKELLEVARSRIYREPGRYIPHIYGEHEVGGTGWLYISDVPFESLGFQTHLVSSPYLELTSTSLSAVPLILMLFPPFLLGLRELTKGREEGSEGSAGREKEAEDG